MRYASIDEYEVVNGSGSGMSLYCQGCRWQCPGCFNPETWDFNGGREWTPEVKEEFLKLVDRPFIKRVSILGGSPLMEENLRDVLDLVETIKERFPDKIIWLYTGFKYEFIMREVLSIAIKKYYDMWTRQRIIKHIDILVDGLYKDAKRDITLKWRGSSNQRCIDVQESLKQNKVVLYCD